jgi:hypothetical protein
MNRTTLIIGLIIIAGMCLVPPWTVEGENPYADTTADMLGMDEPAPELSTTQVVYRPVGAGPPDRVGEDETMEVQSYNLATQRLLLQVIVAAILFGGAALLIGINRSDQ